MDLDSGVAFRIISQDLERIRNELADEFRGLLTSQDEGRWTPHITIQNKVDPRDARSLVVALREGFESRALEVSGLQLIRYLEGKWEPLASWRFR